MQPNDLSLATDPALRGSMDALKRAAASARQTAIQTGTALIVMEGGRLIRIPPEDLRSQDPSTDDHS